MPFSFPRKISKKTISGFSFFIVSTAFSPESKTSTERPSFSSSFLRTFLMVFSSSKIKAFISHLL